VSISPGAVDRPGPVASPFSPAAPRRSPPPPAPAVMGVRGGTRPNAFVLQRDRGDEWSSIGTLGKPAGGRPPSATSSAPGPVASPPSGALVLAAAVASLVGLLAAALYSRISRSTVLDHPARAALYAAATRREAGATSTELAVDAGIDRKTAQYHLVYLVRLGLLRERTCPDGPRRFLAPAARSPPEESPALADLVLGIVALRPGIATAEIARVLSATPTRIERRVKDLLLAGRLSTRVDGGVRRLFVP
ncbi:MAG: helix-turn-helix domain-containing protein, partial [Methanobacteriota archaeon]